MMFVGAMYENSASDLTIEMVLTANRNDALHWRSETMAMKEFVRTC